MTEEFGGQNIRTPFNENILI